MHVVVSTYNGHSWLVRFCESFWAAGHSCGGFCAQAHWQQHIWSHMPCTLVRQAWRQRFPRPATSSGSVRRCNKYPCDHSVGAQRCMLVRQAWRRRSLHSATSSGSARRCCGCRGAAAWSAARSGPTACGPASTWGPGPSRRTRACCSWPSSTSAQTCASSHSWLHASSGQRRARTVVRGQAHAAPAFSAAM